MVNMMTFGLAGKETLAREGGQLHPFAHFWPGYIASYSLVKGEKVAASKWEDIASMHENPPVPGEKIRLHEKQTTPPQDLLLNRVITPFSN